MRKTLFKHYELVPQGQLTEGVQRIQKRLQDFLKEYPEYTGKTTNIEMADFSENGVTVFVITVIDDAPVPWGSLIRLLMIATTLILILWSYFYE